MILNTRMTKLYSKSTKVSISFTYPYLDDPIAYIQQFSQQKREKLENGGEPYRLRAARVKAGDYPFQDIYDEIQA